MPHPLRGLFLNCLLAPLTPTAVALLALGAGWWWAGRQVAEREDGQRLATIVGLAQTAGTVPDLRSAQADWARLAHLRLAEDRLAVLASVGAPPPSEPSPGLVLASQTPGVWPEGELRAAAAPMLVGDGVTLLVGWWRPAPPLSPWPWLALAAGTAAIGGGLGLYLVRRVYRPVVDLERRAALAAAGAPDPGDGVTSPETESLRSSLATLIARSQRG